MHAFLGPTGAGKTTTIRVLLGLLRKDGGEVSRAGRAGRVRGRLADHFFRPAETR